MTFTPSPERDQPPIDPMGLVVKLAMDEVASFGEERRRLEKLLEGWAAVATKASSDTEKLRDDLRRALTAQNRESAEAFRLRKHFQAVIDRRDKERDAVEAELEGRDAVIDQLVADLDYHRKRADSLIIESWGADAIGHGGVWPMQNQHGEIETPGSLYERVETVARDLSRLDTAVHTQCEDIAELMRRLDDLTRRVDAAHHRIDRS